ncbi:AmmeMemoRadiSam system protein A [Caldichromatium japonicum]|uniref:AmmeMemoRadiSam system protein A n=1 Tax=Caldichromatium japonicum TaxID=2699430 RepID=A0A6G7VC81_9GAMM|nr:AmmeMemoRadiSam system protein A [Caldichromatium japonicum]QIK37485.1 AmmeMemoRadiSam system protein A [Caldichromatium japonicum]
MAYDQDLRAILLEVAADSIAHGLRHGRPLAVDPNAYPEPLRDLRATFVTLEHCGQLRGCIGVLEASRPLVEDVAQNAFAAAFEDPRFHPLGADEYPEIEIKVSILTPPEPLVFGSEEELIAQLRPGIDGLILSDRGHRGTFLPAVWEQLPEPYAFVEHLKRKAGLPFGYWSDSLKVSRYETESFGAPTSPHPRALSLGERGKW